MPRPLVRFHRLAAVAACVLSLLAAGCGGEEPIAPELEINFVGTWRGQPWQGTAWPELSADSLAFYGATHDPTHGLTLTSVRVTIPFDGPGTYPIPPGAASVNEHLGGDTYGERLVSAGPEPGVLIVTEHRRGVLTGRIRFDARSLTFPATTSDPVRFDAEFVQAEVRR